MSQTRDEQRFTISEVAADWHVTIVLVIAVLVIIVMQQQW